MAELRSVAVPALSTYRRRVTPFAGWALRRLRELLEQLPVTGRPALSSGEAPVPPRRLRARAGVPAVREYRDGGVRAARELAEALGAAGHALPADGEVLDFGCGAGRVLPHLLALAPGARGTGCDVDAGAIAWAADHRPEASWVLSSFEPPLPLGAERFALVYAISVFSHLAAGLQERWLAELARVLRPGGVALLSVHGPSAFEAFRSGAARTAWCAPEVFERGPLGDGDFVFAPYQRTPWTVGDLPGVGADYGLAFHGHGYLRRVWGREFEVDAVSVRALTGWQDLVVCIRR